ncbi:MAG: hypothetical protein ACREHD_24400 [Pirellulales bacterium]
MTGDKALLDFVYAAQLTNWIRYPDGQLKAKVHARYFAGDAPSEVDIEATLVWRGESCYSSYVAVESYSKGKPIKEREELIETPSIVVMYSRQNKLMTMYKPTEQTATYRDELRLRPDQQWFRLEGIVDWADLLDPKVSKKPRGAAVTEYAVTMDGDDRVVVERRHANDSALRIVASLAAEGNIVEYEGHAEQGQHWRHGTYDWERNSGGRLFVKRCHWENTRVGNRRKPERTFTMEVAECDLNPNISADRFQLSSLDAPPETVVEEIGPGGVRSRRRLGGERVRGLQSELDAAARKLRDGRFAAPR